MRGATRLFVVAMTASLAAMTVPSGANASACDVVSQPRSVNPGSDQTFLSGVTVLSACRAWAVGDYVGGSSTNTLVERWNGSAWSIQTSADPAVGSPDASFLSGVAATSASNAWTVGSFFDNGVEETLVEHFDGSSWVQVPSQDDSATRNVLVGAATTSPGNSIAVGYEYNGTADQTLIQRWNGSDWGDQTSPDQGGHSVRNELFGVTTTSPSNAWAVGGYEDGSGFLQTLILHWNGTAWKIQKSPNPGGPSAGNVLTSVTATSPSNAWAVGSYDVGSSHRTLILHWDGTSWKVQKSTNPGGVSVQDRLTSVTATSATNAWAVGIGMFNSQGIIERWNGKKWSTEGVWPATTRFEAVDASSSTNMWTIGHSVDGGGNPLAFGVHCC